MNNTFMTTLEFVPVIFKAYSKNIMFFVFALMFFLNLSIFADTASLYSPILQHSGNNYQIRHDIILFTNKDKIHGKLLGGDDKKGILWKPLNAFGNIAFKPSSISEIKMPNYKIPKNLRCSKLNFTNGDSVYGTILSLRGNKLKFKTPFDQILLIDLSMLESIVPPKANMEVLYVGPHDGSTWISNSWAGLKQKSFVRDGELVITPSSSIGRNMELPDKVKIDFEFETFGQCQFYFIFFADSIQNRFRNNYSLNIFSGYVYLQKFSQKRRNSINMGSTKCPELNQGKGKVSLLINHINGKISLLVNGKLVKHWIDNNPEPVGKYICFINQSQGLLKISNVVVSKWSGSFINESDNNVHDVNLDTLLFMNDDFAYGTFKSIKDGFITFSTDASEFNVALEKVKKLTFASKSRHVARKNISDVKCFVSDSSQMTLKLNEINNNGTLTGISENFGNVSLKLNCIKKIKMNIYFDNEMN